MKESTFKNCEDIQDNSFQEANWVEQSANEGYFRFNFDNHLFACITIIGQIEGHTLLPSDHKSTKYENMIPRLMNVEFDKNIEGLILVLNTVGGDIEAGMAIAELIKGMKKPTVSLVLGGGHSIGIPLAVSAKKSVIVESATMIIHPVRTSGVVLAVPQQLAYFSDMQERIIKFICENSDITMKKLRKMMMASGNLVGDFGTILDGITAVNEGIIDRIGNITDAITELANMC